MGSKDALRQGAVLDILAVQDAWEVVEGFAQPDWKQLGDYICRCAGSEENLAGAWHTASLQWLGEIRNKLGPDHVIFESKNFLLVTKKSKTSANYLLNVAESALNRLRDDLKDLAWRWKYGKHVILIIEDVDEYYRYISHFYPEEGEFATSGGIFLNRGYCHTVLPLQSEYTRALIHELTHLSVSHLHVPLWLNEGLATTAETRVTGFKGRLDAGILKEHRAHWNNTTIQGFWSGKSFRSLDEERSLSYSLSEVLVSNMRCDFGGADFQAFAKAAKPADAGESAALEHLHVSLGDIAATFLGKGNWAPVETRGPSGETVPAVSQ